MFDSTNPFHWFLLLLSVIATVVLLRGPFSPEARARRRRDRNHGEVISKVRRPIVKLAVEIDEKKKTRPN